jgi:1-acyl-sn-glycerol-3-phosphate acyltransferase
MSTVIAALRTAAAVIAVALYVLLLGPPSLIWALLTRRPNVLYAAGVSGVRTGLALAGITVRVLGREHVQARGAVYACNHTSNIEPPSIFYALRSVFPKLRIVYKAELRKLPVLVWAFDVAGFVPLERANPQQSRPAVDRAAGALRDGNSFVIFPEGTRSRSGELLPFKKGGFVMAIKAQAPIVPVAVSGGRQAMRKGSPLIWPTTVTVHLAPPVETAGRSFDDRDAIIAEVRQAMLARLPGAGPRQADPARISSL